MLFRSEITSIPISIEYKVNAARLEHQSATADVEISRQRGGLSIKSRPVSVNIDTFEARSTIAPTPAGGIKQQADRGRKLAYEATARFVEEGNMMMDIHLKQNPIAQIAAQTGMKDMDFNIGYIPEAQPDVEWMPAEMQIRYELDKLNFDWRTNQQSLEFIPATIEFTMAERPRVVVEYVGGPIYVPRSADPNYEPLDTKA